jgi:hypothetical protein
LLHAAGLALMTRVTNSHNVPLCGIGIQIRGNRKKTRSHRISYRKHRYRNDDAIPQGAPTPLVVSALGERKQSPTMAMDERLLLAVVHPKADRPLTTHDRRGGL